MASPQVEDGFTRIANELLEALSRTNFSCYQRRVLDAIVRKTYGYGKKADRIPLSQIALLTGIQKGHVSRSAKELIERNVVTSRGTPRKLGINKNYHDWRASGFRHDSKTGYLTGNGVTPRGNFSVPDGEPQKKRKKIYCPNSDEFRLGELLLNLILERRPKLKKPDLQKWAYHIDLMIRQDNRDVEEIQKVIEWCQADRFWQNNILSTSKLREQFDQLALKMGEQTSEIRWDEKRY